MIRVAAEKERVRGQIYFKVESRKINKNLSCGNEIN